MSGLLVEQSLMLDAHTPFDSVLGSGGSYCDSPLMDALALDELDLLNQLLDLPEPTGPANAYEVVKPTAYTASLKRERCSDCCEPVGERSAKRPRAASIDGKPAKGKSQSQRQREEISSLKQQAEELSAKLAELQERKRQHELSSEAATSDDSDDDQTPMQLAVGGARRRWQGMAKRQQVELQSVEVDNASLREEVSKRWEQMQSLQRSIVDYQIDQLRQTNQHGLADELTAVIAD